MGGGHSAVGREAQLSAGLEGQVDGRVEKWCLVANWLTGSEGALGHPGGVGWMVAWLPGWPVGSMTDWLAGQWTTSLSSCPSACLAS